MAFHFGAGKTLGTLARRTALAASAVWLLCAAAPAAAYTTSAVDAGRGWVTIYVPSAYTPSTPTPLVLVLHGYGWSAASIESYFKYLPLVDSRNFLYALPEGRPDVNGNRFWTATDACCNFYDEGGPDDDSSYLRNLIDAIRATVNVDSQRIFLIGHSAGAFMAFRMACDHSDIVAAIVGLSGATWLDPTRCKPRDQVHVLEIHGTADDTVLYDGGYNRGVQYPGVDLTTQDWSRYDGCDPTLATAQLGALDLTDGSGAESDILRYASGCHLPGSFEHWRINDGSHVPTLSGAFDGLTLDFLFAHPKQRIRFLDHSMLVWPADGAASVYDVYRGQLPFVDSDRDGLPDNGYGSCVSQNDPNRTDVSFYDPIVPSPGQGYFYTVGYEDRSFGVQGGIGVTSAGIERPLPPPCP